jgi:hypothetical protein
VAELSCRRHSAFLCVFNFFPPALLSNLNGVPRHIPSVARAEPTTFGGPNAKELSVMDIIVLAIGVVSFALYLAYVTACDSL